MKTGQPKKKLVVKKEFIRVLLAQQLTAIRGGWPKDKPDTDSCIPQCMV